MPPRLPDEKRDAIAAAIRDDLPNAVIMAAHGVSDKTITKIARECGLIGTRERGHGPARTRTVETGQVFGRLTVTDPEIPGRSPLTARCRCECGNVKAVRVGNLYAGGVRSCGCLRSDTASAQGRSPESVARLASMSRSPKAIAAKSAANRSPQNRAMRASPEFRAKLAAASTSRTHGLKDHPLYQRWVGMMHRCFNPKIASYPDYGGRGITVEPWLQDVANYIAYLEGELTVPLAFSALAVTAAGLPDEDRVQFYRLYSIDRRDNDGNYERGNLRWADRVTQNRNTRKRRPPVSRREWEDAQMEAETLKALYAAQDDCLIAVEDGRPVPAAALQSLPPWRAVMCARLAAKAGVPLERGTVAQIESEARAVGGDGVLGDWWERV